MGAVLGCLLPVSEGLSFPGNIPGYTGKSTSIEDEESEIFLMNAVDITPETVEQEYRQLAEDWGCVDEVSASHEFQPETISSPESLSAQQALDVPRVTLERWKDDASITPALIRHNTQVSREFIREHTELAVHQMAGLEVDSGVIDAFALSNAKLLAHYYPKGGVLSVLENYGLWLGALTSTAGLVFAVKRASEANVQRDTKTQGAPNA